MEKIYQSEEITVLQFRNENDYVIESLDVNIPPKGATHLPRFPRKKLYVDLGGKLYWFIPSKSIYGLRYYMENGELSTIQIATFCDLEGINNGICVILGKYEQSVDSDWIDSANPFSDPPPGRMNLWSNEPRVFYESEEKYKEKKYFYPKLVRVTLNNCAVLSIPEEKKEEVHNTAKPTLLKPNDMIVIKVNREEDYLENPKVKEYLSRGYVVERRINLMGCSVWLRKKTKD